MHAGGFDQPGFCEPFPHEDAEGRDQRGDEQQCAVVRAAHACRPEPGCTGGRAQPEGEREKQAADDVHLLRISGLGCDFRLKWIITMAMSASGTLTQKTTCPWWNREDHRDAVHRADDAAS